MYSIYIIYHHLKHNVNAHAASTLYTTVPPFDVDVDGSSHLDLDLV